MYYKSYSNVIFFLLCMIYYASAQQTKPQIILSSRWFHPTSKADSVSTLDVIKKLNPDRIDWTYTDKEEYLDKYRNLGIPFSLALNPQLPDSAEYTTSKTRIVTVDGENYVAPWMKKWNQKNPYWGCVNNPQFVTAFETKLAQYAKIKGLDAFFIDDEYFNFQLQAYSYEKKVGCVCSYCLNQFSKINSASKNNKNFKDEVLSTIKLAYESPISLTTQSKFIIDNYKKFQEVSVIQFWKNLKTRFPNIRFKMNNYGCTWNRIRACFDEGIGELEERDLTFDNINKIFKEASTLNKQQIISLISANSSLQNWLVAYCLINRKSFLIPWDIYINGSCRYYGNVDTMSKIIEVLRPIVFTPNQNYTVKKIETSSSCGYLFSDRNKNTFFVAQVKRPLNEKDDTLIKEMVKKVLKKTRSETSLLDVYKSNLLYIAQLRNTK